MELNEIVRGSTVFRGCEVRHLICPFQQIVLNWVIYQGTSCSSRASKLLPFVPILGSLVSTQRPEGALHQFL